jgi:hypothetical protein
MVAREQKADVTALPGPCSGVRNQAHCGPGVSRVRWRELANISRQYLGKIRKNTRDHRCSNYLSPGRGCPDSHLASVFGLQNLANKSCPYQRVPNDRRAISTVLSYTSSTCSRASPVTEVPTQQVTAADSTLAASAIATIL